MIIKKKAIISGLVFKRMSASYFEVGRVICSKCKYHVSEDERPYGSKVCKLCDKVLDITKLGDWDTEHAYLPE